MVTTYTGKMDWQLDAAELRVLGALMEKEKTTPEYYPMSLNALVNACNQKSNRDPVVAFDEETVETALDGLRAKGLSSRISGGSRVPKHEHRFTERCNLGRREEAVLCVLMLRGPQTVGELRGTASLTDGSYQPQPVRGVQIPKPGGGQRQLGIPVVVDRLVQQAILQVLNPILDPTFSNSSYGFRPGRDAHMALEQARKYVAQEGREFVVDLDLEKFFDRVNHDILMSRIARRIGDKRLLLISRRFF